MMNSFIIQDPACQGDIFETWINKKKTMHSNSDATNRFLGKIISTNLVKVLT